MVYGVGALGSCALAILGFTEHAVAQDGLLAREHVAVHLTLDRYHAPEEVGYIPNDRLALNLSGTKDMAAINITHFEKLAAKAHVPEFLTKKTVNETIEAVHEIWNQRQHEYPLPQELLGRINQHIKRLKLV